MFVCNHWNQRLSTDKHSSLEDRSQKPEVNFCLLSSDSWLQKKYFKANCMILGSLADVTLPKSPLSKVVFGLFMTKLFVTLKASARNSSLRDSRNWKVLERAASHCHVPGPGMLYGRRFPSVPSAGCPNAEGLR